MPHRYRAPEHTSSIMAPTRPIPVSKTGMIELPDNAPEVEHEYLRRAGCVPVSEAAEPVEATPAKGKRKA